MVVDSIQVPLQACLYVHYFFRAQCDIENLRAYCYCMLCFSTFLADECLLFVGSHAHLASHYVLYLEHQLIPPHSALFPITAVSPPPPTPGPTQTETTSQPSLSLWEAARKWTMCADPWVCVCVSVFCILIQHGYGCRHTMEWVGVHVRTYVCMYVFACAHSSLQGFLPLQWALHSSHTLGQHTPSLCVHFWVAPPLVSGTM